MNNQPSRNRLTLAAFTAALLATVVVYTGLRVAAHRHNQPVPAHPVALILELVTGKRPCPPAAGWWIGVCALPVVAITLWVMHRRRRGGAGVSRRADPAAGRMGRTRELHALTHRGATRTATRLGVTQPGLLIGRTVTGGHPLYQGWEDVAVDIAGPRTGKTTGRVIPAILEAPGAVVTTSNKRDSVDATRDIRADHGQVWVFDPQGVVDEPASWWWNPLTYVTDEVRAATLAGLFNAAVTRGAQGDAFFEPKGEKVVAALLLANALADRPITQTYLWVADPNDREPVDILRHHGFDLMAASLASEIHSPPEQRAGVFGTAEKILAFLTNRQALAWITPTTTHRPRFDPVAFAASTDTLYSLSKEGKGSAGALVAGLTVAVTEAAERLARRSPAGRLTRPMVVVLDEAANVCRWPELPNVYSHYGSRGIVLLTMLQSWSQGVEVWGKDGMRKLWSAATVKLYGGGVSEVEFLNDLSSLIGDYDRLTRSVNHSRTGRSTTVQTQRTRILDTAALAALPKGRAVLLAAGAPATLIAPQPWMAGPAAHRVAASIRNHDTDRALT